jgi:NADH-quinone oxidoreductase subunit N
VNSVQHVDWALVAPVLGPAIAAVLVLVLDAVLPRGLLAARGPLILDLVAGAGLLAGAIAVLPLAHVERGTFCVSGLSAQTVEGCSYAAEPVTTGLQLVILLAAGVCLLLAIGQRRQPPRAEHHLLLLTAAAGAVAVAGARDLATLLVALETASLPVVGLVALRRDGRGAEAAVKLLLTSVVSVALLVLGIAMLYAASGTLYLGPLGGAGTLAPATADGRALAGLGILFAVAGIAFKISVVPFQLWTPDTYAGAPLPVAAFLAAVSKAAGVAALVVVLASGAPVLGVTWTQGIGALAALTMTVGNLVALRQRGAVRLLAWSTVAQAGWVILPLAGAGRDGQAAGAAAGAAIAYLAAYIVASLLAFAVVAVVARTAVGGDAHELSSYAGLVRRRPVLGAALAFALVALAGLPPGVFGLVAKVLALRPVVADHYWLVAGVAVVNVALGIAVYLRWAVILLSPEPEPQLQPEPQPELERQPETARSPIAARASRPELAALIAAGGAAVLFSLAPQLIAGLTNGL